MGHIKLKIDIRSGIIEVETDVVAFSSVMDRAEILLDKFANIESACNLILPKEIIDLEEKRDNQIEPKSSASTEKKLRRPVASGKAVGWKMVDNLLDEDQRKKLRGFYLEKKPFNQNEKVAVLAYMLKELLGRDSFSGDEIYTAFQTVNERTPKNLIAVFGNMAALGLGNSADKKFKTNFKSDDLVKHDLPRKKPEQ